MSTPFTTLLAQLAEAPDGSRLAVTDDWTQGRTLFGGLSAAFCALAIRDGLIPPTLHLEQPDEECDLDYTPRRGRRLAVSNAMSLSFGFGGQIGVVVLGRSNL